MSTRDVIAIGGSTGALDALKRIFANLPADLPAAVFIIMYITSDGGDVPGDILDAAGPMAVKTAAEGDIIRKGRAYVALLGSIFWSIVAKSG